MIQLRGIGRFLIFLVVALYYLIPILIRAAIKGDDLPYALYRRRRWAVVCSKLVGVNIDVNAPPRVDVPTLYISNHRSYYDPVAVLRDIEALPVAKAEVSGWPFIGFAARSTGIMFVKRENRESRKLTVEAIEETLKGGHSVMVYPEGTTHTELKSMPFRLGAFRVAAALGTPVVPIAIEYSRPEDAWIGTDSFIPHFLKVFGRRRIYLKMRYGAPLMDDDPDRLAGRTQEWIDEQVAAMRREWFEEKGLWENS